MALPTILTDAADKVKLIDEKISRISNLLGYQGILRVYTGDRGMDSAWDGMSDTVCGAVSEQAKKDVSALQSEKAVLLTTLLGTIENAIMETGAVPATGPLV
jgi:hypothetical protein